MNDAALIRRYLSGRSEADFTELVQRHLPMVRRSALRQTGGNEALADEVAQAVFVRFATKLPSLAQHPALAGWLHTATRHAASEALRAARRRRQHELEAERMSHINREGESNAADWARIQPVLDAGLRRLPARDREAVLLRYFEDRPLAAIASQLGLKEDATRMRVNRALGRLRRFLESRGILTTEAALAVLLDTDRAVAEAAVAPAACASTAHGALAASGAAHSALWISPLSTTAMAMKKTLVLAGLIGAVIGGIATAHFGRHYFFAQQRKARMLQVQNDRLRDRITRNLLAGSAKSGLGAPGSGNSGPAGASAAKGLSNPDIRLSELTSDVKLRAASRDALPTEVAHPLKFRGYDTPLDAYESFTWSAYNSDPDMVARSIYLDDAARAAVEKVRQTLSPEMQAEYPTAESLLGLLFAYDAIRYPGPNTEDIFVDAPPPKYLDSDDFQAPNGEIFHHTADGWKLSVPAQVIPGFANAQLHPGGS